MGRLYRCVQFIHGLNLIFGFVFLSIALTESSCFISDSQEGSFPVVTDTKVPWSDEETLHLLDIWGKDSVQRALKGCLKNRHIFTQIAQKMAERGYMRTVEQCQTRIKRLKKCFRQNKWAFNDTDFEALADVCQICSLILLFSPWSVAGGNSRLEHKFYTQLDQVLGSSASLAVPEITYDVEEIIDEDESRDGDDDLQFVGQTGHLEIGRRSHICTLAAQLLVTLKAFLSFKASYYFASVRMLRITEVLPVQIKRK